MEIKRPHVENRLIDPGKRITYVVMAYRPMSDAEIKQQVGLFLREHRSKLKPGTAIRIETIIGLSD